MKSGTIKPLRNLSLQADSIGTVRAESLQSILLLPHSPSQFGGVDVAIQASPATDLLLLMDDPYATAPVTMEIPLRELLQGTWLSRIDSRGNRIAIERQVSDKLRISSDREQNIFEPGEDWPIRVEGYRTGLTPGQYMLEVKIETDSQAVSETRQSMVSIDSEGSFKLLRFDLNVPKSEGPHQLVVNVQRKSYLSSFVSAAKPLVRRLELVVVAQAAARLGIVGWTPVAIIDPLRASKPGSLAWLSSLDIRSPLGIAGGLGAAERMQPYNPLAGSISQPLRHGNLESRELSLRTSPDIATNLATCLTLEPDAWLALPINGLSPGVPHRLRVRVPLDQPMELIVSVQQSTVNGASDTLSIDSGLAIGPRQVTADGETFTHDLVFWPKQERAHVILACGASPVRASVLEVRLERAEIGPLPNSVETAIDGQARRMLGINLDKPLLADGVSAPRETDLLTGRSLETWKTWHDSAIRLTQLMHLNSANTLLIKGFSDGGAIFPEPRLEPSHRFDSGTFFADGRSPDIKDAIELLLRHFDRAQYRMILALDLNSAFPALLRYEQLELEQESQTLWQQPMQFIPTLQKKRAGKYNPLDKRVQEETLNILRAIVARYGHHPSFAGICIQLDQHSQLVFSGDRWGYDPKTLQAFENFAQLKLPPAEQMEAALNGPARLAFLDWRAQELTKFYGRMGDAVARGADGAKLYLNPIRLWDKYPTEEDFYHPEAIIRNPHEYLLAFGISPERLAKEKHVVLMRGAHDHLNELVNSRDWVRRESGLRGLAELSPDVDSAALLLRYPQRHTLLGTEQFGGKPQLLTYPTLWEPHPHARKRLTRQIFLSDPLLLIEGGWLPLSAHDHALRSIYQTLHEFPPVKLTNISLRESNTNLRLRIGKFGDKTYLQIVNNASWPEQLRLKVHSSIPSPQIRVLGERSAELSFSEGRLWSLEIPPYDIIGLEISDPSFSIAHIDHAPAAEAIKQISEELNVLETLVSQAADPTQQKLLANIQGDFETWTEAGQPVGWSVSTLPQVTISQSFDLPHSGRSSLQIENSAKNASAWIQSRAIQPPATGRIAVRAWLRAPAVGEPLLVRLSVIARTQDGERFESTLDTGARSQAATAIPIDWGRKPITLFVGDLSAESISELYVSIELIGPGKIWVDDVEVLESYLQPEERNHLRGQMLVAKQQLGEKNPYPAEQLLDSHWGQYLIRFRDMVGTNEGIIRTATNAGDDSPVSGNSPNWSQSPSLFEHLRESVRSRWRR